MHSDISKMHMCDNTVATHVVCRLLEALIMNHLAIEKLW